MAVTIDPTISPFLAGPWAPVSDELDATDLPVHGELPTGLRGTFLRNGPNPALPPKRGRYHLFDGDGMVHAVYLDGNGGARYRNRWVESAGLLAERAAGEALYPSLVAWEPPDPRAEAAGFLKNTANTALVRHAGRLLALMEAAPPTELTMALDTVGEWDFGSGFTGPMTAHPKVDPVSGEMLAFGYSPLPPYLRYHVIAPDGRLVASVDLDLPAPVMMHDFAVTERYAVFFDLPAVFDLERMLAGGDALSWEPERGARIGLVARDATGDPVQWFEIEPCYVFHFLNAFEEPGGRVVHVDGCRAPSLAVRFTDEPGRTLDEDAAATPHRWTIDLDRGTVALSQLDDRRGDFPQIDPRRAAREHRIGYFALNHPDVSAALGFQGVGKLDLERGETHTRWFGRAASSGEAVFAAAPGATGEDEGWLLTFVTEGDASRLAILDAHDLTEVASIAMPRRVPLGFHALWVPETE